MTPAAAPLDWERTQRDIEEYCDALLQEQANWRWAVARFGGNFDEEEWSECFESGEPDLQAKRSTVLWPFGNGFNCLNEILRRATWIKAGHEIAPAEDMRLIYKTLRQDGALNSNLEKTLGRLNRAARNALTHRYPETDASDLREAMLEFDSIQPELWKKLGAWLTKKGYSLG